MTTSSPAAATFRPFTDESAAEWIWSEEATHRRENVAVNGAFRVRLFRKSFSLAQAPASFPAAISADGRYVLFVNGRRVGRGPAKGDVDHQFYDTYDLAPELRAGRNVIAVRVVDYSPVRCCPPHQGAPASIVTYSGGFAFDAGGAAGDGPRLVSDKSWRVATDASLTFGPDPGTPGGFVGYTEHWHVGKAQLDWRELDFDDSGWAQATELYSAQRFELRRDSSSPYGLLPRMIPFLRGTEPRNFTDIFFPGGAEVTAEMRAWIAGQGPWRQAAGTTQSFILDAGRLESGFPLLRFSGGAGAAITLTYAEALRLSPKIESPFTLRADCSIDGIAIGEVDRETVWTFDRRGVVVGNRDRIFPDGRAAEFEPTHWRTFRYIGVEIKTGSEPIEFQPPTFRPWNYPLDVKTSVETGRDSDRTLWETSFRTLQLCCHETFEDCPYYEQLQYAGDSIITSRLMLHLTGDGSLTRQAILHFAWSILPEGLTTSRYPSCTPNVIPSWSIHWITILHGYVLLTGDREFARSLLRPVEGVLDWFRDFGRNDPDGLPGKLRYWNCVDWTPGWNRGQPPGAELGPTCSIASQFVQALRETADLQAWCGLEDAAVKHREEADGLARAIDRRFWNEATGAYRESEQLDDQSTLGNAWAVYAGVVPPERRERVRQYLDTWAPANASYFGMYFIFKARRMLGANTWWEHLGPWEKIKDTGLTTWPEDTSFWRSLCHAWSAHPITEYLEGALGLEVKTPGWTEVVLRPNLGPLPQFKFELWTPLGPLSGQLVAEKGCVRFELRKPAGMTVTVINGQESAVLKAGREEAAGTV